MNTGIRTYRLTLITPMLGTIPKSQDVYDEFIATRDAERATAEQVAESSAAVPQLTEEEIKEKPSAVGKTGFFTDKTGILLFDYQIRGLIREAGNTLAHQLDIKNLRSKLTNLVFVGPRVIRIYGKNNEMILKSDTANTRPIRVITMQGPRTSIVQSDQIGTPSDDGVGLKEERHMDIEIKILENKDGIDFETIEELLSYGELQGLLQFRTGGYGRFTWKMLKEVQPLTKKKVEEKEEKKKK